MTDEKIFGGNDRELQRALTAFRDPPEPDTERMWARIAGELNSPSRVRIVAGPRRTRLVLAIASVSVAATLALVVFKNQPATAPTDTSTFDSRVASQVRAQSGRAATAVAIDHMNDAETVLQALALADGGTTAANTRGLAHSAQTLLAGNRVVRGAQALPVDLEAVLDDLELVLTQLAAADRDTGEIQFAALTARERDLVGRMRRLHEVGDGD